MSVKEQEKELKQKASQMLAQEKDVVQRFKGHALKERGLSGIKKIGRNFRIMDDSGDRRISKDEFRKGCHGLGLQKLTPAEIDELFEVFDKDGSGYLDYNEFLAAVRPAMNEARKSLVNKAFAKMDKTGDGIITVDDLQAYDVRHHPKFRNGEMSKKEVLLEFLESFDARDNADGTVTQEEFMDYYSALSASIDDDAYFSLMMYNSWKVKATD